MASCQDCVCKLNAVQARAKFGAAAPRDTEMCQRFGRVLSNPRNDQALNNDIQSRWGSMCDGFIEYGSGLGAPSATVGTDNFEGIVTSMDPELVFNRPAADAPKAETCLDCKNFVPAQVVFDELGWSTPLCAATGRLLFNAGPALAAQCEVGVPGRPRDETAGLDVLPIFKQDYTAPGESIQTPIGAWVGAGGEIPDPTEYKTDKPVSQQDEAQGIRAWRVLEDPAGFGPPVSVPVYNFDFFNDHEQSKIPRNGDLEMPDLYVDHQNLLYDVAVDWHHEETPVLQGHTGVGKTEFVRHAAWLMVMPFDRISISPSTDPDDLIGKWLFINGETVWVDGRIPIRYVLPGHCHLDEPNTNEDIEITIRPLMDNSKQLVLDAARGEKREKHRHCFLSLSMNPAYDPLYVGTSDWSVAGFSRASGYKVEMPPANVERDILTRRCFIQDDYEIPVARLDTIMRISHELRELSEAGGLPIYWGLRQTIAVARKSEYFPLEKCFRRAATDLLEPETAEAILGVVRNHI